MIISDTGIEENSVIKKGQEVSVIYPSASTKEEQAKIVLDVPVSKDTIGRALKK